MPDQKILDLIPESLRDTLIEEVKDLIKKNDAGGGKPPAIDPEIKAYVDKNKKDQKAKK
jgi:hypothetical protein